MGDFYALKESAKRTVRYLTHNIHGLLYTNKRRRQWNSAQPLSALTVFVESLKNKCDASEHIAYKGGIVEKNLLLSLGFTRNLNLEHYGCPKFENLTKIYGYNIRTTTYIFLIIIMSSETAPMINKLNKFGTPPNWLKLKDMELNLPYLIEDCYIQPSKFDKMQVVLKLSIGFVSLPTRFSELSEQDIF